MALREHLSIIEALEAGDAAEAERWTRHHVRQASLALSQLLGEDDSVPKSDAGR